MDTLRGLETELASKAEQVEGLLARLEETSRGSHFYRSSRMFLLPQGRHDGRSSAAANPYRLRLDLPLLSILRNQGDDDSLLVSRDTGLFRVVDRKEAYLYLPCVAGY